MTTSRTSSILSNFCVRNDLSRSQAYREIKAGRLKAQKRGRHTIITADAEREWLENMPAFPAQAA